MPRYYFSIRHDNRVLPDREGVDLGGDADLRECALYLARRLGSDRAISEAQIAGCAIEVTNTDGDLLVTVPVPGA